jgi:hypothetical protein
LRPVQVVSLDVGSWPSLAWLAVCEPGADAVTVYVGRGVEVDEDWLCEGVWDGAFEEGGFDRTDLVFGSGVRRRSSAVDFVSSGTTMDRLHSVETGGRTHVSNSLSCLLSFVRGSLEPAFVRYPAIFRSIVLGLDRYERTVTTDAGPVQLTYFHNLRWDGAKLVEVPKPAPTRDFGEYERYRSFLSSTMSSIVANARTARRRRPLELITTLSSGYDSPTAAVIAQEAGCTDAVGFDRARGGDEDSGAPVAQALGLRFHAVETSAWRSVPMAALPFLAAISAFGSSVSYRAAEPLLRGRLVFTGYHGDKMWGPKHEELGPDLVRVDGSGNDLTEYRLWAGFINCPVPFWGAHQIADVHATGWGRDMGRWKVKGWYSRPICRRIVEGAGVPRDAFGTAKRATAQRLLDGDEFLTPDMRHDYATWLGSRPRGYFEGADVPVAGLVDRIHEGGAGPALARYVPHWAVARAKEHYPDPRPGPSAAGPDRSQLPSR